MPRPDAEAAVTLSVLDRLIDSQPESSVEAPLRRSESVQLLKASLRRDLEWLLNTRRTPLEAPDSSPELRASLYDFGVPDISSMSVSSPKDQNRLTWLLESVLSIFEPRLQGIRVGMVPPGESSRTLRFQIEGLLRMDPAPERISFDTVFEATSGNYQVKGERGAR